MARQGRLHVPHGTYLVIDAFQPGHEILVADPRRNHSPAEVGRIEANRRAYDRILTYEVERWRARVHVHCWLPDQAIFLLQIGFAPIESIMHGLRGSYSRFMHKVNGDAKTIHSGSYVARLIDPEEFFLDAARQILLTPVFSGLTSDPIAYEFSSIGVLVGRPTPAFLSLSTLQNTLVQVGVDSRWKLLEFLRARAAPGFAPLVTRGSLRDSRILGRSSFVRQTHWDARRINLRVHRDQILSWVEDSCRGKAATYIANPGSRDNVEIRALVGWLVSSAGIASLAEVARWFSCSTSTLTRAISRRLKANSELYSDQVLEQFEEFIQSENSNRR